MEIRNVDDPRVLELADAIIRIIATAICGSDLHLYHHSEAVLGKGYVIGHEPMGIVGEVGSQVQTLKKGQRMVIPFNTGCSHCHSCLNHMESQCDESNPDRLYGGLLGFDKLDGNRQGGQTEYLRVPYADSTLFVVPNNSLPDEKVLFLSGILPIAYWDAENVGVRKGNTIVILGSSPVSLFTQKFAVVAGTERVITADPVQHCLDKAVSYNGMETYFLGDTTQAGTGLCELAKGSANAIIDCVGMDGLEPVKERAKNLVSLRSGTISPLQVASQAVKKFGTVQVTGVYMTPTSSYPFQEFFIRDVAVKHGQAPIIRLVPKIYEMIAEGLFGPAQIATHSLPLGEVAQAYEIFDKKENKSIEVVLKP